MRRIVGLLIYRLLLPVLFILACPGWIIKMLKRGGFGTRLGERFSIYATELELEPCRAVHVHAVSVGETLLALKLIRRWHGIDPKQSFVLAIGTATGHAVATRAPMDHVRVTYAPLDFQWMVRRYLHRFEPAQIVLIEGEVWPNLMNECQRRAIPVRLINARMSPRSARRYRKFARWLQPVFGLLDAVALQQPGDADIWKLLGVKNIECPGSLKFDPDTDEVPRQRPEFSSMLDAFSTRLPIALAASTHPGEEVPIARAIHAANAFPVIVPRHAERRDEVRQALERAGFTVVLRSEFRVPPASDNPLVFVIDSTGELRDWTAHADVVVIGKSFLTKGGQNPCEAILANKPVICGPHMENFEPLSSALAGCGGCIIAKNFPALTGAVLTASDRSRSAGMTAAASACLARHAGATGRLVEMLR